MPGETVSAQEFFSEVPTTSAKSADKGVSVSVEEFFGNESPAPASPVSQIPDEHKDQFLQEFGSALYEGMGYTAKRLWAGVGAGASDVNNVIGFITGLNSFKKYRDFVASGRQYQQQVQAERPDAQGFERVYYSFVGGLGAIAPTLLIDVMTGGATKIALTGRILPKIESMLSRMPNFVLGSGWRGMVEGIEASSDSLPEKVAGGVIGAGETMAVNTLFANAGLGLKGIGKMASIGAADAFYNAAKEGRLPTSQEVLDGTTQAAMMGAVFTMLPHLVEGSQVAVEKVALEKYSKRYEKLLHANETDLVVAAKVGDKIYKGQPGTIHAQIWQIPEDEISKAEMGFLHPKTGSFLTRAEAYKFKQIAPQEVAKLATDLFSDQAIRPEVKSALLDPWREELRRQGSVVPYDFQLAKWKDPAKLGMFRERTDRIIENVAKGEAAAVKAVTTDFVDIGNNYMARWESEINRTIQDRLFLPKGITPNSALDAAVMRYGEKRTDIETLKRQFPEKWQDIKKAADWSRSVYEETIDFLNDQRRANGRELIHKRDDYFRHTQEIRTAAMIFGHSWFDMANEPTSVAGIVNKAKYGAPFNPTTMERLGGKFQESAILAMQDYVKSVAPEIFHTETVRRIRALEQYIRAQALINETEIKEGKLVAKINLSNFVTRLSEDARIISGAPSNLTQWFNEHAKSDHWFDRVTVGTLRYMMKNSTMNMIAGNVSAAAMNFLPVDQQIVTTDPRYIAKGHTIAGLHFDRDVPLELEGVRSNFYDRRFPRGTLAKNWYENVVDKGYIPANRIDRHMVMSLISGKFYEQFEKHGKTAQEAMDIADKYADRVVQDRSYGKVPPAMSEPELQLINRFQVEINNLWSWLSHDLSQEAKGSVKGYLGRLATFAIIANLTNNMYQAVLGRRPQLDFIEVFGDVGAAVIRQNPEYLAMAGKALLGNVPFGNLVVPGGRVPAASVLPDVFEIADNPDKWFSEMCKPFVYGNPLGYGAQIKKTIEGVKAWTDGGVYTPAGNTRYEVQRSFTNFMRGFLFGKNAFPEAVERWNTPPSERD